MSDKETSAPPAATPPAEEVKASTPTKESEEAPKETSPAPAPAAESTTEPTKEAEPESDTAPTKADETDGDAEPKTNGTNGTSNGNGNGDATTSAPVSKGQTRTSSRVKQEASTKPAPAPKAAPKPKQPRASGAAAGVSKKQASGSGGDQDKKFSIGDIVLARLKGYPAWPARIADPDDIPQKVAEQRPSKNPMVFCVQFFPVGDYSWLNIRDLSLLTPTDISSYLSTTHRKAGGGLREAYQTAQDPTEWDEGQAEIRAKMAEGEEEVDQLDDDEDADEPAVGAGGKRKKASAGAKDGAKKKAKTEKKKDDAPKSKSKAAAKPKASKKGAAEAKPEVENQAGCDDDQMSSDPECIKVKDWRHKLQRAFLGKSLPEADEMESYDELFKSIEKYDGMTIEALQYSKIGKVMKKIAAMSTIPKNEEFKITDRAQKLMNEWQNFIEKNSSGEKKENGGMEVDA